MDSLQKTLELIDTYPPMTMKELEELELERGFPKFDVLLKHTDDENTMWGKSKLEWPHTSLRELANDIYDYVDDGYEVWVRETPRLENDPSRISKKYLKYAMTLEADNLEEDGIPLRYRLVNGWFVISRDRGMPFGKRAKKFYSKFDFKIN